VSERLVPVGRVGRPHGRDGSFYVEAASAPIAEGSLVTLAGREVRVLRRGGTDQRPLVRLEGVEDRDAAGAIRGEALLLPEQEAPLEEGEWLAADLVGLRIAGLGEVTRVIAGPSCDLLEVGEGGQLVPFVSDAIRRIDVEDGLIEVDRGFLGLTE
jgi:16S rRNA processing protein RimM